MLKCVYHKADETILQKSVASVQQWLATMNAHPDLSLNTRISHSGHQEGAGTPSRPAEVNLEEVSIHFLRTYSVHPNWNQIVSSSNDYGQTIAHISVTLGYLRLLRQLFTWEIDLNAVDNMGLSALHYAYLFKQEGCARFLIHSRVDQSILDDLGRSASDLDPSLEVRLHSTMDIDGGSNAGGTPPIECDTGMPDDVGSLYAKHFLIQRWMQQGGDERSSEVPLCTRQGPKTLGPPRTASSPPALDSADDRAWDVTYGCSSSLGARVPEENSTLIVAEEMDLEAPIEVTAQPHITLPRYPISEVSAQTQEADRPSNIGQKPLSHPTPLGGAYTRQLLTLSPPLLIYTSLNRRALDTGDIGDSSSPSPEQETSQHRFGRPSYLNQTLHAGPSIPPAIASVSERHPSGPQATGPNTLIHTRAKLEATGQKIQNIAFIVDIVFWITNSEFLRLQQPEPMVGEATADYPVAVDIHGIKGESIYTALFNYIDMEVFTCKLCDYAVKDSLEDAVTHQRAAHFDHRPYRCTGSHTQWYVYSPSLRVRLKNTFRFSGLSFASQAQLEGHQLATGH